jgi:ribonuclease J
MLELTRPLHILPSHGEARHMALFADLALELGWSADDVTLAGPGDVVEITPDEVSIVDTIVLADIFIDAGRLNTVTEKVVRDRRTLARDGVVTVAIGYNPDDYTLVSGPEIVSRGFVQGAEGGDLVEKMTARVEDAVLDALSTAQEHGSGAADATGLLARRMRDAASSLLFRETRRRPLVLPVVLEV